MFLLSRLIVRDDVCKQLIVLLGNREYECRTISSVDTYTVEDMNYRMHK